MLGWALYLRIESHPSAFLHSPNWNELQVATSIGRSNLRTTIQSPYNRRHRRKRPYSAELHRLFKEDYAPIDLSYRETEDLDTKEVLVISVASAACSSYLSLLSRGSHYPRNSLPGFDFDSTAGPVHQSSKHVDCIRKQTVCEGLSHVDPSQCCCHVDHHYNVGVVDPVRQFEKMSLNQRRLKLQRWN